MLEGSFRLTPAIKPGLYPGILVWNSPWPRKGINSSLRRDKSWSKKSLKEKIQCWYQLWFNSGKKQKSSPTNHQKRMSVPEPNCPWHVDAEAKLHERVPRSPLINWSRWDLTLYLFPWSLVENLEYSSMQFLKKLPQEIRRLPKKMENTQCDSIHTPKNSPS